MRANTLSGVLRRLAGRYRKAILYGTLTAVVLGAALVSAARMPIKRAVRLAACDGEEIRFSFSLPPGEAFSWVLEVPGDAIRAGARAPFTFSGTVTLHLGDLEFYGFRVDSARSISCSWLVRTSGNAAYLLTRRLELGQRALQPGRRYRAVVRFDEAPRTETAIWLCWIQRNWEVPRTPLQAAAERRAMDLTRDP